MPLSQLARSEFSTRDINFRWLNGAPADLSGYHGSGSLRLGTNMGSDLVVQTGSQGHTLEWERLCTFLVSSGGAEIGAWAANGGLTDGLLYATVFPYALHLMGTGNIHAGAVVTQNGAVGFLASPGSGKSTLTARLAARGLPFLTDDVLALSESDGGFLAQPGFPYVSLSRQAVLSILGPERVPPEMEVDDDEHKLRIPVDGTWASFADKAANLAALFVLARDPAENGAIRIQDLRPADAVRELIDNTISLRFLPKDAVARHMAFSSKLVARVPVRRLSFPSGFNHTEAVIDTVLKAV